MKFYNTTCMYLLSSAAYAVFLWTTQPFGASTPVMLFYILMDILFLYGFWIMKTDLFELSGKFKTHKTNCTEHPTEDVVNYGMFLLPSLRSTFGLKYLPHYQCKASKVNFDIKYVQNKNAELYHRFQGTMCVLHRNEFYLYVMHLVMSIALLPYEFDFFF